LAKPRNPLRPFFPVLRLVADPPAAAERTAFQARPALGWARAKAGFASGRQPAGQGGPVVAIMAKKGNDALAVRRLAELLPLPEPDSQGRSRL
jgi:hypothetical protein